MKEFNPEKFISHIRQVDVRFDKELLSTHLIKVGDLCKEFSSKMDLPLSGGVIGFLHDLGKYSSEFQYYIRGIVGLLGDNAKEKSQRQKGKINHATAGGKIAWEKLQNHSDSSIVFEILANCIISHHTGLHDYLGMNGDSPLLSNLKKGVIPETNIYSDQEFVDKFSQLDWKELCKELRTLVESIDQVSKNNNIIRHFYYGMVTRFLFSCLIDADHTTAANFESPEKAALRTSKESALWKHIAEKFEEKLKEKHGAATSKSSKEIQEIRKIISEQCRKASTKEKGFFTLSAPTGGGKTLSSLRFALHHAKHHTEIERIIYVIPYTSIIEQNAQVARECVGEEHLIEHHCNLSDAIDTERNKLLSENWDAPIIFTTMVQFLDSLFSGKTSDARRMHQLAKSVIIFDEIQTLPIKTVYLFNNAVNFLVKFAKSSVVLCTATQPLLHKTDHPTNFLTYPLPLTSDNEIVSLDESSTTLHRTQIIDECKNGGWTTDEIADITIEQCKLYGSTLVVVNTKDSAYQLYKTLNSQHSVSLYYLTTNMCPIHRKDVLQTLKNELRKEKKSSPIVCISTQLIEAGVDINFGSVIRYLAGLDSIVQSAGRCNRHGLAKQLSPVIIVNPKEEKLTHLRDIEEGQKATDRVLEEFRKNPDKYDNSLLSKKAIDQFYFYYFFKRKDKMYYPVKEPKTTLFDLLSTNKETKKNAADFNKNLEVCMCHGFRTAGQNFRVIDTITIPVIVPYREGDLLIKKIASAFTINKKIVDKQLLRRAQQYSVELFQNTFNELKQEGVIHEAQEGCGLYHLDKRYYSPIFGFTSQETEKMQTLTL